MTLATATTLELLAQIGDALGRSSSFDDALRDALWRLVRATKIESAALFAVAGGSCPHVIASSDDDAPVGLPVPAQDRVGLVQTIAGAVERQLEAEGVWHFPLRVHGEVFAVLEARCGASSDADCVAVARAIAGLIAPAVHASDLYRALGEQQGGTGQAYPRFLAEQPALEKYREFFKRASDGVAALDQKAQVLLLNPAARQITGYATEGLAGRPFADIVHHEDREAFAALVAATLDGSPRNLFDVRFVTTSGDTIVVSMSTSVLSERDDVVVLSFRDITERRQLSEELRRTKSFLERLIDSAYDAVVASDIRGRVVLFSKVAERVFARQREDVVGQMTLEQLYPPEVLTRLRVSLTRSGDDGPPRQDILRDEIIDANGARIPVQISGSVLYEDGEEVGTVANICDLREKLRMERQLIQTEERLVESEKQALIAELAGTTAHELNQPLTSIMGYAELMQRRAPEDDPNRRAAEVIYQESQRMAAIVRQIGRITRYQTKTYLGETQILDLQKSSDEETSDEETGQGK